MTRISNSERLPLIARGQNKTVINNTANGNAGGSITQNTWFGRDSDKFQAPPGVAVVSVNAYVSPDGTYECRIYNVTKATEVGVLATASPTGLPGWVLFEGSVILDGDPGDEYQIQIRCTTTDFFWYRDDITPPDVSANTTTLYGAYARLYDKAGGTETYITLGRIGTTDAFMSDLTGLSEGVYGLQIFDTPLIDDWENVRFDTVEVMGFITTIDEIYTDTNEMQSKLPTNNIMGSSVKDDMDDEINAIKTDTDRLFDSPIGSITDGSFADQLMNKDASQTFDPATDSLEAIRDRGDSAWAGTGATKEEIADAVWDEALSGHAIVGSAGKSLSDIEADTNEIQGKLPSKAFLRGTSEADGGMDTDDKADINAEVDQALVDYDPPTRAEATADKNEIIAEVNANETKIDAMQGDVTEILTDTADIQPRVVDIDTRLPTDPADQSQIDARFDNLDLSVQANYDAIILIQNNVSTVLSGAKRLVRPDAGTKPYRFLVYNYDNTGNMQDFDADPTLTGIYVAGGGTYFSGTMTHVSTGEYSMDVDVAFDDTLGTIQVKLDAVIGGSPRKLSIMSEVSDYDDELAEIKADTEQIISDVAVVDDLVDDIHAKTEAGVSTPTIPAQISNHDADIKALPRIKVNAPNEMYVPQVKTKVNKEGGIGASDTTIPVFNTDGLNTSGIVKIDDELITYTGIDPSTNELTGCTRGSYGTVATTHNDNAIVKVAVVNQIFLAVHDNEGNMVNADSTPTIELFNWEHTQILAPTNMTAVVGYTGLYYYDHIIVQGDDPANFYIRCEATSNGILMAEDVPVVVIDRPASETTVVSTSGGGVGDYACDQNGWYDGSGTLHPWGDVLEGPVVDAETGAPLDDCYVTFYPIIGGEAIITDRPTAQTLTKPGGSWLAFVDAGTYLVVFKKEGYRIDNGGRIERTVG